MVYISEVKNDAPTSFKTDLQKKVYCKFQELGIVFERVDTDEVITMEDCIAINEKMQMKMVKTLFLCNRQQTEFYLFVTCGDKPFRSKEFSHALGISRVSFAPAERMAEKLQTVIGAATALSALVASSRDVKLVFDSEVLAEPFYGCSDGTTTSYLKLKTSDLTGRILPLASRTFEIVTV